MDTGARTRCDATLKSAEAGEDVAQLLREGASLIEGLGAARTMYGPAFAPAECLRALTFFDDGDLATVDEKVRQVLRTEVAAASRQYPIPAIHIESRHLNTESTTKRPERERGDLER